MLPEGLPARDGRGQPRLRLRVSADATLTQTFGRHVVYHCYVLNFEAVNLGPQQMQLVKFGSLGPRTLALGRRREISSEAHNARLPGSEMGIPFAIEPHTNMKFVLDGDHHRSEYVRYFLQDAPGRRWYVPRRDMRGIRKATRQSARQERELRAALAGGEI